MPDQHYDVVIVGARCSGASLAAFLAQSGKKVAMIDRDALPSDHVLSTHTIHPAGMDVLDALGVGDKVREVTPASRVIRFDIDGGIADCSYANGRFEYCPRRFRLDAWLEDAAIAAGAALFDRTRVVGLLREGERVMGVRVRSGEGERDIGASLVVGADGRRSTVAEDVGAREYLGYDAPRGVYWAYWPMSKAWRDKARFPFDLYITRKGTHVRAIFQTDGDELVIIVAEPLEVARAWRDDLARNYRGDLESDSTIAPIIEGVPTPKEIRGTIKERYFFRAAVGPGWALVGDAGHHKDYLIGDGITEALRQSRAIAHAIMKGGDRALLDWWRERDREALPMFRFAEDQGTPEPTPHLWRWLFARLGRRSEDAVRLLEPFERTVSPYDGMPLSSVLLAVADGLRHGDFAVIPDFLAQGRRIASVKKEIAEFAKRDIQS